MRILCFGDSFTYGVGMPDHVEHGPNSLYAYPQLLAHNFKTSALNYAAPGASNKEIWNIILQTKFSPADAVVIMWSHPSRTCVINTPQEDPYTTEKWKIADNMTGKFWTEHQTALGTWHETEQAEAYYKHIHNDIDAEISTQLYMSHIDLYLRSIGISIIVHAMIPHVGIKRTHWNNLKVLKFFPSDTTPDGHAGIASHVNFAKIVSRQITKHQIPPKVIQK